MVNLFLKILLGANVFWLSKTSAYSDYLLGVQTSNAYQNESRSTSNADSDLVLIKHRLFDLYVNNAVKNSIKEPVEELLSSLQTDGSWQQFNYNDTPVAQLPSLAHLYRLVKMAVAYRDVGSQNYKSNVLGNAIHNALQYWLMAKPRSRNGWFTTIGIPVELCKILILMEDELSVNEKNEGIKLLKLANQNGVLKYGQSKATGQNMIWTSRIQIEAGCLENSPEYVAFAAKFLAEEISVTTKEGIQPDWSFHQHGPQLYSGGYGLGFIADCSEMAYVLDGTKFSLSSNKINILTQLILDGDQWMIRANKIDYGTMGREIARMDKTADKVAYACDNMVRLNTVRKNELAELSRRIKNSDTNAGVTGNKHFWRSDFMVQQRKDYYTSVKMSSSRVYGSESGNGEGEKDYHLADGCTYLMRSGKEYENIFPLWDWQKIPGVTCRLRDSALPLITFGKASQGTTTFVGGVSDGVYGMAAFDFFKDSVTAHKSWFYFDKEIVCLGAGISSGTASPVITAINQCYKKGKIYYSENNNQKELKGEIKARVNWVYQDGVGYMFPNSSVVIQSEYRQANWKAINRFLTTGRDESGEIFSLWIDHGIKPVNKTYEYAILPAVDLSEIAGYVNHVSFKILSNTKALQAVEQFKLGILQAAFYESGSVRMGGRYQLKVDKPCLVMINKKGNSLSISISSPENKPLVVQVTISARLRGGNYVWDPVKAETNILFNLPDGENAGQTITQVVTLL